ncbi:MAG: histidinol dehydrogenase [Alphaproteobacteria bacterium]|nr:histidinol dehydrogenase [Alphaproteobacteria bacterium]
MNTIIWEKASAKEKAQALARPVPPHNAELLPKVSNILNEVKLRGDAAVCEFTLAFDGAAKNNMRVSQKEIDAAVSKIDPKLFAALKRAKANIEKFHKAQIPKTALVETMPGVKCALMWRPIETAGLYIPAGTAPLFSTLLMLAVPAQIAGCRNIVLCSPPQRTTGKIHPAILAAAKLCGVTDIFAVGGAQAIAAMAYGTRSIPKVDKIFGPGNVFVTLAKQLVSNDPLGAAIDMPAGPSEVLVIADAKADPAYAAADLLAQAEHDPTSQVIFVTTSPDMAKRVSAKIDTQLATLSRREIAQKALSNSRIIVVKNMDTALEVSNAYAPEHLIILQKDAAKFLPKVAHAGSVFLGPLTPEPAGDYASGTNHVLPTYGYARSYGGVSIFSFLKTMTAQSLSPEGLRKLGPSLVTMAEAEGLQGHANAVKVRMETAL